MPDKKRKQPAPPAEKRKDAERKPGPMTPATGKVNPADKGLGKPGKNEQHRLDEALEETFPASDPVSTRIE